MSKTLVNKSTQNLILPERRIFINGTTYRIHGLVHDNPWIKISSLFKQKVSQQLNNYPVLCEDGFTSWIPNAVSMDEASYFNLEKLSFFNTIHCLGSLAYFNLFEKSKRPKTSIISKVEGMNTIKDLVAIRNQLFQGYSSEPEGMNSLMENTDSGTIDLPTKGVPLRVKRYIYESLFAVDYVQKKELKEVHLVVGCAHERPLEYLLSHKEVLDKYSL